jgi:hypothetical protein
LSKFFMLKKEASCLRSAWHEDFEGPEAETAVADGAGLGAFLEEGELRLAGVDYVLGEVHQPTVPVPQKWPQRWQAHDVLEDRVVVKELVV